LFKRTSSRSRGTASGRAYLAFWHASEFTKRQVVPISCQVMLSHVGRSAAKYTESLRAAGFERDGAIDYLVVKRQFTPLAHAVLFAHPWRLVLAAGDGRCRHRRDQELGCRRRLGVHIARAAMGEPQSR